MQSKTSELREELAVLRARLAQLEAQAPDPSRERLITQNSLMYLVKYAAKPSNHPVSGRGGHGGRGGCGGRGGRSMCQIAFPIPTTQEEHVYSLAAPQLVASDDGEAVSSDELCDDSSL